uniref:Serine/arginine-rich splicing factor 2 n=1 Tax=Globodera rostochiensis TaxID=31243 RepID=A0A914I865_GLORO
MGSRRGNDINFDELHSLKVDNLPYDASVHELRRMFDRYGDIGDVYIPRDRYNNHNRGFGFVRYYSRRDAEYAVSRVDGRMLSGRELRVSSAKYGRPIDEERDRGSTKCQTPSLAQSFAVASPLAHSFTTTTLAFSLTVGPTSPRRQSLAFSFTAAPFSLAQSFTLAFATRLMAQSQ